MERAHLKRSDFDGNDAKASSVTYDKVFASILVDLEIKIGSRSVEDKKYL